MGDSAGGVATRWREEGCEWWGEFVKIVANFIDGFGLGLCEFTIGVECILGVLEEGKQAGQENYLLRRRNGSCPRWIGSNHLPHVQQSPPS